MFAGLLNRMITKTLFTIRLRKGAGLLVLERAVEDDWASGGQAG